MERAAWFGGRLRELREQKGLSQRQLADQAGMNKDALARLERGERSPSWETVLTLAEALGVECTAFVHPPAERPPAGPGRPPKAPPADPAAGPPAKKGMRPTK
jgi:transcriptional regulator with XRE-family HTH domain